MLYKGTTAILANLICVVFIVQHCYASSSINQSLNPSIGVQNLGQAIIVLNLLSPFEVQSAISEVQNANLKIQIEVAIKKIPPDALADVKNVILFFQTLRGEVKTSCQLNDELNKKIPNTIDKILNFTFSNEKLILDTIHLYIRNQEKAERLRAFTYEGIMSLIKTARGSETIPQDDKKNLEEAITLTAKHSKISLGYEIVFLNIVDKVEGRSVTLSEVLQVLTDQLKESGNAAASHIVNTINVEVSLVCKLLGKEFRLQSIKL